MNKFLNKSLRRKVLIIIIPVLIIIPILLASIFFIKSAQSSTITFITSWGSFGTGNAQFNSPKGIAIDSTDNVYVADFSNNRIQKFDSDGTFLTQWGVLGEGNGEFVEPWGIAVDSSDNVYVSDSGNARIQKFTSSGTYVTQWGSFGTGNGEFDAPIGIAVDLADNVYVADSNNSRIQKFTSSGTYVTQWGSSGTGNGEFSSPYLITIDPWNDVYVADTGNNRVQKFDSSGIYITKWGSLGAGDGQFGSNSPRAVVADLNGYVYVVDRNNSRIEIFDTSGSYISKWGSNGTGDSEFDLPESIAIDSLGRIYVVDGGNNRISKFSASIDLGPYSATANTTTYIGSSDVNALLKVGDTVYMGGVFGMEAINVTTGQQISWTPNIPDDPHTFGVPEVFSLAYSSATETLYAGSSNGILSFDASTAAATLNSWTPEILPTDGTGEVYALEIVNNTLYAGGEFTSVDTQPRINLAAFDISTPGGVLTSWTADTDLNTRVYTLKSANSLVYVGGTFTSIQSVSQPIIAAFDPSTGDIDATFNPVFDTLNGPSVLAITYNNGIIYAGGHFDTINAVNPYTNIASLSASTGTPDSTWTPSLSYDVHALATKGNYLYIGESDEDLGTGGINGGDIVAFNMPTGAQADWNPADDQGIHALIAETNALYVGLVENQITGFMGSNFARIFRLPVAYAAIGGLTNTVFLAQFDLITLPPTPTLTPTNTPTPTPTTAPAGPTSTPGPGAVVAPVCTDTKPGLPSNVTATAGPGSGQISLSWTAAPAPVTDYSIVYSDDSTVQKWGVVSTGNATSYVISGLSSNVTYYFWVNPVNGCMPGDKVGPANVGGGGVSSVSTPSGTLISTINPDGTVSTVTSLAPTGPLDLIKAGALGLILMIVGAALLLAL